MTCFQFYPETKLACKYIKLLYKTQFSETIIDYEQGIDTNTGKWFIIQQATHTDYDCPTTDDENLYIPVHLLKNTGQTVGKVKPKHKDSTRLQELSLMNNTYFGAIHFDIHLDMKLDYTIGRIFQEISYRNSKHHILYANLKEHKFCYHLHLQY